MRPASIGSPSTACVALSGPDRDKIRGRTLVDKGGTCTTTKIAAGRSAVKPLTIWLNVSTPPADAPITTMSCAGMAEDYARTAPLGSPDDAVIQLGRRSGQRRHRG